MLAINIMSVQPARDQHEPGDLCKYCKELATYDGIVQIQKKCIFRHDTVPAVFRRAQADRPYVPSLQSHRRRHNYSQLP